MIDRETLELLGNEKRWRHNARRRALVLWSVIWASATLAGAGLIVILYNN